MSRKSRRGEHGTNSRNALPDLAPPAIRLMTRGCGMLTRVQCVFQQVHLVATGERASEHGTGPQTCGAVKKRCFREASTARNTKSIAQQQLAIAARSASPPHVRSRQRGPLFETAHPVNTAGIIGIRLPSVSGSAQGADRSHRSYRRCPREPAPDAETSIGSRS